MSGLFAALEQLARNAQFLSSNRHLNADIRNVHYRPRYKSRPLAEPRMGVEEARQIRGFIRKSLCRELAVSNGRAGDLRLSGGRCRRRAAFHFPALW